MLEDYPLDYVMLTSENSIGNDLTWDVTSVARDWYADESTYYGVALKQNGDDGTTKIDLNGNPLKNSRDMTPGERRAFKKLYDKILETLSVYME